MASSHTSVNNNSTEFVWMKEDVHTYVALSATSDHLDQLSKQFPVLQSVVVTPLAGQQHIIHMFKNTIFAALKLALLFWVSKHQHQLDLGCTILAQEGTQARFLLFEF